MPLLTDDIGAARNAYLSLERRAAASEVARGQLQVSLDDLRGRLPALTAEGDRLRQTAADQAGLNAQLVAQNVVSVSPDMTLAEFIAQIGLAAALGEATMPDRSIPTVSCSVRTFISVGAAGGTRFALRFHQPELGNGAGLSATTFEITRTPPAPGGLAAPNLYSVLQDKQQLYADPAWAGLVPAAQILTAVSQLLAAPESWSIASIAAGAAATGAQEKALAALIENRSATTAAALATASDALAALAAALEAKPFPVAGDLLELAAGLYRSSKAARPFVRP